MNVDNKATVSPSRPLIGSTARGEETRSAELELENKFWLEVHIAGLCAGILPPYVIRREK